MNRMLKSPWLMWLAAELFCVYQFILQLSVGVMIKPLMQSFNLTAFGVGALVGSFYVIYVLLQMPAGMLVDRFGPRRLLAGGAVLCSIGCIIFALTQQVGWAFAGRALTGIGASFAFISTLNVVEHNFPAKRFSIMVGLVETVGMLSTMLGNIYSAYLLHFVQWRILMFNAGVLASVLGLVCYLVIRDKTLSADTATSGQTFIREAFWILRQPKLWWNGIYAGLMFSVITVFAALWVLPYLELVQHTSTTYITFEGSMVFVGLASGAPLMGWLYSQLPNRHYFLFATSLLTAILIFWIVFFPPQVISFGALLFFFLGVSCSSYVFNFTLANHWVPRYLRSTSIGFTNALSVVIAPILQPVLGAVLNFFASPNAQSGHPVYTVMAYHRALFIIVVGLLIASGIAWMLKEKPDLVAANSQ